MKHFALMVAGVAASGFIASASAADMAVKAPPPPPPVFNWAGFYVGGNLGYSFGRSGNTWDFFAPGLGGGPSSTVCPPGGGGAFCASGVDTSKLEGLIGGFQAGYNWRAAKYLFGLEADFQFSGQKRDQVFAAIYATNGSLFPGNIPLTGTVTAPYSEKLAWLGTVRGRVGGFVSDRLLIYATGGLAVGQLKVDGASTAVGIGNGVGCTPLNIVAETCPLGSFSNSVTRAGWTLGAGIEGAFAKNWSWKVEYLHVDLGTVNTTFATLPGCYGGFALSGGGGGGTCSPMGAGRGAISSRITDEIVRVGINYHFVPGTVVARY